MNIKQELINLIVFQTAVEEEKIVSGKTWKEIGIDSLDTLEIMLSVNDKFNIEIAEDEEEDLDNFDKLLKYVESKHK